MGGILGTIETAGAELTDVIVGMRRVWRRRLRRASGRAPLTANQSQLLHVVERNPGIGIAAAARELHLADNSVSTLVMRLSGAGLLARRDDPRDGRAARLEVTAAARERLEEWRTRRRELIGAAFGDLAAADRDAITAALPALRRLLARLESAP